MRVWRIEHTDGRGPYHNPDPMQQCACTPDEWLRCDHPDPVYSDEQMACITLAEDMEGEHTDFTHPIPYSRKNERDLCDVWTRAYSCCFTSVEQMAAWFDGWLPRLRECGYLLTEWEADEADVLIGQYQAGFLRPKATLISSAPVGD